MISSGFAYWPRPKAMPMLAEVKTSRPPIENGVAQRVLNPERDGVGLLLVAEPVQQDRELVAAEPGERVALPQTRLEPARHRDQQLVADQVAETVVDDLEAIEVEVERREPSSPRRCLNSSRRRPSRSTNTDAVAEAGQRIAEPGAAASARARATARSCRSAIRRCGWPACRRRARRRRGTGTADTCRPRGECRCSYWK